RFGVTGTTELSMNKPTINPGSEQLQSRWLNVCVDVSKQTLNWAFECDDKGRLEVMAGVRLWGLGFPATNSAPTLSPRSGSCPRWQG
ncbi:hypothetical protein, partial [Synoicihabitans lomoniglobus]|uniref:hypothetical protein n=1 Tax=Synoicihabitans lomoniglobus TaxID=2909285 RepID=UPI002ED0ECCA|nr:hypothetical protein [Opitutaceae bacterium LMO-M01]